VGIVIVSHSIYVARGVAIMVDLGGAETNSEMAVEMLPVERRGSVVVCNAPIVEGAPSWPRPKPRAAGPLSGFAPPRKSFRPVEMERKPQNLAKAQSPFEDAVGSVKFVHAVGMHARPATA
jgi:hypothetical protein